MNETIRRILAESGTKTSKIRKLLLTGLSHREIADLVTRGNRGFVWNVYKRMRDEGLLPACLKAGTRLYFQPLLRG
jgi:transposase